MARKKEENLPSVVESALIEGDLNGLDSQERLSYYNRVCESLGLNPLTQPFAYIKLQGKLTLYAKRDATEQLRRINKVSVVITGRDKMGDVYCVTARATLPDGRTDESTGVVTLGQLRGDALANALMKAETKAKRRVTLSICGLGWLDETETETIPTEHVNKATGEIQVKAELKQIEAPEKPKARAKKAEPKPEVPPHDGPWYYTVGGMERAMADQAISYMEQNNAEWNSEFKVWESQVELSKMKNYEVKKEGLKSYGA